MHKTRHIQVLDFIMGARSPQVLAALAPYGFNHEVLVEGTELLRRSVVFNRTSTLPSGPSRKEVYGSLDAFENLWFPIVRAALSRYYPPLAATLFADLGQATGKGSTFGMMRFLSGIEALGLGQAPFGEEGLAARALLVKRGFTQEIEAEGARLLRQIDGEVALPEGDDQAQAAAHAAVWEWYKDWRRVARTVIKDRGTLRSLGLRRSRKVELEDEAADDELDVESEVESPALPAAPGVPTIEAKEGAAE